MKAVLAVVYRYLTNSDYFNIYKPPGAEAGGGGQTYIDIPTTRVSIAQWEEFLGGVAGVQRAEGRNGPEWRLPVNSVGLPETQQMCLIYQRRLNTVVIANQNINTQGANRVSAWLPENGFPEPADPQNRRQVPQRLAVFLVRTGDEQVWAGWFHNEDGAGSICRDGGARRILRAMIPPAREVAVGMAGIVSTPRRNLRLDEDDPHAPFASVPTGRGAARPHRQRSEEEIIAHLFAEDTASDRARSETGRRSVVQLRQRNSRAVRALKELYRQRCQLTGDEYTFRKVDGTVYCEAHHLIPLGRGGADNARNIIVVSHYIHTMLHYADVAGVDLTQIREREDGEATLDIRINGEPYTITWHRDHARLVTQGEEGPG